MKAVYFEEFGVLPVLREVPEPLLSAAGVIVRVEANGLCRSDWHGWLGHDPDIALPHVPGHELVGVIDAVGPLVRRFQVGQRVTVRDRDTMAQERVPLAELEAYLAVRLRGA